MKTKQYCLIREKPFFQKQINPNVILLMLHLAFILPNLNNIDVTRKYLNEFFFYGRSSVYSISDIDSS